MEEWKDIEGYEGLYQVSSEGKVKSLERDIKLHEGVIKHLNERVLKPKKDKKGYLIIGLCFYGEIKYYKVNRLVAQRDMGIKKGRGVSMCCRGILKTYKGYKWSYEPL